MSALERRAKQARFSRFRYWLDFCIDRVYCILSLAEILPVHWGIKSARENGSAMHWSAEIWFMREQSRTEAVPMEPVGSVGFFAFWA